MKNRYEKVLNVLVMALVAALLIGGMEWVRIRQETRQEQADRNDALRQVLPAATYRDVSLDADNPLSRGIDSITEARNEEQQPLGYVVALTADGYDDPILLQAAISPDGDRILGVHIVDAGTGSEAQELLRPYFGRQFDDLTTPIYLAGDEPEVEPEPRTLRDGTYTALAEALDETTGFRYSVQLVVRSGIPVDVTWDGTSESEESTLRQLSRDGMVSMPEDQLPWHEQAIALEALVLDLQDPALVRRNPDGSVAGLESVDLDPEPFLELAETCVRRAAVASALTGSMRDGFYQATGSFVDEETGYQDIVDMEVADGVIVALTWDGTAPDSDTRRREAASAGQSDPEDGVQSWAEQATRMQAYLLDIQDPTVVQTNPDGTTEDVPDITIRVDRFLELVRTCMTEAGMAPAPTPTPAPEITHSTIEPVPDADISSRAVVDAVNQAAEYVAEQSASLDADG